MNRTVLLSLCLIVLPAVTALAQTPGMEPSAAKELSGMSIIGNDDAPKSLYIVPWKSAELGMETSLTRTLNEGAVPVDREVFLRELDFYQVSVADRTLPPTAGKVAASGIRAPE